MMTSLSFDQTKIDWAKGGGLVPVIVQDVTSARVLMLGYMNREAFEKTLVDGIVTFFSRSKKRLWTKGETSGNRLDVCDIRLDCDYDTLLITARPLGPICHTGRMSCFGDDLLTPLSTLADLESVIARRQASPLEGSYTSSLFASGLSRMAQKVGEEGVEVALAGALGSENLCEESADLLYHLIVLLRANGRSLGDALAILTLRAK